MWTRGKKSNIPGIPLKIYLICNRGDTLFIWTNVQNTKISTIMLPWKPGDVGDVTKAQTRTQFIGVFQRKSYCLACSSQCYVHGSRSKHSTRLRTSNVGQNRPSGFSSAPTLMDVQLKKKRFKSSVLTNQVLRLSTPVPDLNQQLCNATWLCSANII